MFYSTVIKKYEEIHQNVTFFAIQDSTRLHVFKVITVKNNPVKIG